MPTVPEIHRRGTRAAQPAAPTVTIGTLYFVTDEALTERSDGTTWQAYGGGPPGGGTVGDVLGPASAAHLHVAVFEGTTGKLLKDGGASITEIAGAGEGDVVGPGTGATPDAVALFDGATGLLLKNSAKTLTALTADAVTAAEASILPVNLATEVTGALPVGSLPAHAARHQSGGSDAVALDTLAPPTDVLTLNATVSAHGLLRKLSGLATDVLKGDGTWGTGSGGIPGAHHASHENGGADEINVAGLSGVLADGQPPLAHHASHETGGADAITALAASVLTTGTIPSARLPPRIGAVGLIIDGGGSVITPGVKGFVEVPFACIITAATLLSTDPAVTSGSIVVDIWKDTYAAYPPVVGDSITASAKPTLTSAVKSRDTALTGWTTAVAAGDVLGFKVDSVTALLRVTLSLTVQAS